MNISICKDYIWIAPINKNVMDKKFKDNCRINNIPRNIRAYISYKKIDLKDLMF